MNACLDATCLGHNSLDVVTSATAKAPSFLATLLSVCHWWVLAKLVIVTAKQSSGHMWWVRPSWERTWSDHTSWARVLLDSAWWGFVWWDWAWLGSTKVYPFLGTSSLGFGSSVTLWARLWSGSVTWVPSTLEFGSDIVLSLLDV